MSIIRSELQVRSRATLGWVVGVVLLVVMIIAFYPAVRNLSSLDAIYAGLPKALQGLLGGSDLVSPTGYLRTQLFAFFLPVVLLIFGMGRGAATLAGEEEDRTLDLLLAQPISRVSLYVTKSITLVIWMAMMTAATFLPLAAGNSISGLNVPIMDLLATSLQMGLMCTAAYIAFGLSEVITWLGPVRPFTLWRWYLGNDPLTAGFEPLAIAVSCAICVAVTAIGAWAFSRRDLHA